MKRENQRKKKKKTKTVKRFDPVLKNLFSETAKVILALAGIKEKRRRNS